MAHELTFDANGVAQMFSVTETPWHREGHILTAAPTLADALALAGAAFTVEKRPTYRQIITGTGLDGQPVIDYVENTEAFITARTDTGAELGAVGAWYTPLQNRDAFAVLEPLLEAGVAALETGGSLRGGADVWMLVRFDLSRFGATAQEVFGDEVLPFGLIANNHAGRRGCLLQLTPIRVVCANTLGMSERAAGLGDAAEGSATDRRAILVRHTQSVEAKVVEAAQQLFAGIVERYETIAHQYRLLRATYLDEALFRELVLNTVAPDPRDNPRFNPEARMAESVLERAERKRAELTRLWTEGRGHRGDHSAWEAYNGVVEALDHNGALWPTRGGAWRTAALMNGRLHDLKQQTLDTLVAYAAGEVQA